MFCGIDLGTSGVKAAVYDELGQMLGFSRRECELILPRRGWAELNPRNYWDKILETLEEVSFQCRGQISVIGISSQAQAVLPLDTKGTPLYPIIVTMDNRTLPQHQYWSENFDPWDLFVETGNTPSPICTLNKIMWHKENLPHIYEHAWKFCCVQDYAGFLLTGEAPLIDYSMAGRTMMLSPRSLKWSDYILDLAGIEKDKLPRPAPSTTLVGSLKASLRDRLRLKGNCRVALGGHDQACGAIGSGVIKPGMMMDACGTVDAMVTALPGLTLSREMAKNKLPCYRHADNCNFITMAINTNGGLFFKWYKITFCNEESRLCSRQNRDVYTYMIEECADTPSDLYVLPHLEGAGTHINDPRSLGAIVGLRVSHTKKDITRAVLESLAYEMKGNLTAIEKGTSQPIEEIRLIGGGAKTPKWLQIKADIFNRPITTLKTKEAASLGAAIIGAVGTGGFGDFKEAMNAMVHPDRSYEPNQLMVGEYEARYREYQALYPGLKDINHGISYRTS